MLGRKGYQHRVRICNRPTYCFSRAKVVARTRLRVTLYVHSLSCLIFYPSGISCHVKTFFKKPQTRTFITRFSDSPGISTKAGEIPSLPLRSPPNRYEFSRSGRHHQYRCATCKSYKETTRFQLHSAKA